MSKEMNHHRIPIPFIIRRLHSLMGLGLVFFIIEHLWVNAQVALLFKDHGASFIHHVNRLHALPWIKGIEVMFLAIPFFIHMFWGVRYLFTGAYSSFHLSEHSPYLPYRRNKAYSWQRLTAWILVIGVIAHVTQMRFIHYPQETSSKHYHIKITQDPQLAPFLAKLDAQIIPLMPTSKHLMVEAPSMGSAFLIILRDSFKSFWMVILYALFVIAATYHAFNGLWTFCITWGITLTQKAQHRMRVVCLLFMMVVSMLGLSAIFGLYTSYLFNL